MATGSADELASGGHRKAAVLLIVGEPFTDDDKQLFLEEIVQGFKSWDSEATGVDINDELAQIGNRAELGEEGPNGERIIHHSSEKVVMDLLINPQSQTVKDSLKTVLSSLSATKVVIYVGYAFQGTAAWVVQDDLFAFSTLNQVFKDPDVENALKQIEGASLMLHTTSPNDWKAALKGSDVERLLKVSVNPVHKLENVHGVVRFTAYVAELIRVMALDVVLQASDVIGSISFVRPVLYIFPGHHGDSALFGMKGFNMLIDGGYSRRACYWDFVRHLDGVDALLLTHLGPDNLFGIKTLLERKNAVQIHPDIDFMFMNAIKASNGTKAIEEGNSSPSSLVINLAAEGNQLLELSRKLGHAPHPLTRPLSGNLEPINLFHKVGLGSLDMYVLNPVGDAKEMKDFLAQWGKQAPSFSQTNGIPIPNCTSVCALLVVRPESPTENVTRILFPGTAPQHKLIEGLERVKHLEFLKHPTFCTQDLQKPKKPASAAAAGRTGSGTRKPPAAASRSTTSTKSEPASRSTASSKPEPPKRLETKAAASKVSAAASASAKTAKLQKDSNNKRASSAKDKEKVKLDEKEKEDKSKSSTSSSPSKASVKTASPVKTPSSPAKTPATVSPSEPPEAAASPSVPSQPVSAEQPSPVSPAANHLHQDLNSTDLMQQAPAAANADLMMAGDNRLVDTPEALPEPVQYGSNVDFAPQQAASAAANEQQNLRDLGIYDDDDDDEGVDNGFDDRESGAVFGTHGSDPSDEVQPQSLPEPAAAVETPSSGGPDLIQDTFCQSSAMEQSQLFEQEIEPDYSADVKEASPVSGHQTDLMGAGEQSYSDKEPSPDLQEKDSSPPLEEPSFADDAVESQSSNAISQSIQYGMTNDNGFQMGGIREEEEEEEDVEGNVQGQVNQAGEMNKQSMEEMGIYDDEEGLDEDEEAGDHGKDAYAYENDVNIEDEEIRMAGSSGGEMSDQLAADQDPQSSNIPEAFERDESPVPVEKQMDARPKEGAEVDSGQEDTDSIDGGTPDRDKDIDETAMYQQSDLLTQKQDSLEDVTGGQEAGPEDSQQQFNPFIGLGAGNQGVAVGADNLQGNFEHDELDDSHKRGGSAEFDPLAQWGPPTGLPAPCPLQNEVDAEQGDDFGQHQQESYEALADGEAVHGQEDDYHQEHPCEQDRAFHGFGTAPGDGFGITGAGPNADTAGSDKGSEADPSEFDPLAEWGQPMGLPSPPPANTSSKTTGAKGGAGDTKKPDDKKHGASPMKGKTGADKRPASATKGPAKPANGTAEPPKSARSKPDPKRASLDTSRSTRPASGKSLDSSRVESKTRTTVSAPTARKPASSSKARASPDVVKMPPLPAFTPFYMDLTYIPNHGDISYVDVEFFKRVRARNYVLSARNPNPKVLEMLIEAKATWDKTNDQEVTVIPTYETQILQHWMAVHKEKLAESKIEMAPAASRCTVRLQDHQDSCYTYRLQF